MCYDLNIPYQDVKPILEKLEAEDKIFTESELPESLFSGSNSILYKSCLTPDTMSKLKPPEN